jgi:UDP-N-acetylmuramate dehydrogenase
VFNYLLNIVTHNKTYQKNEIKYGYRFTNISEIIFSATFQLEYGFSIKKLNRLKSLRNNQPSDPSAGSCFKNPSNFYAGQLIEEVGLKGYSIGSMQFSTIHANFLVNNGNGTFKDAMSLINLAKKRVYELKGVQLEEEITIITI